LKTPIASKKNTIRYEYVTESLLHLLAFANDIDRHQTSLFDKGNAKLFLEPLSGCLDDFVAVPIRRRTAYGNTFVKWAFHRLGGQSGFIYYDSLLCC